MELVYTYAMESSKDMNKMLDEEFWKRLGPTVRECKAMGLEKEGMCLYIKAKDELAQEAQKLLADTAAKELKGEEGGDAAQGFPGRGRGGRGGHGGDVWVGYILSNFPFKIISVSSSLCIITAKILVINPRIWLCASQRSFSLIIKGFDQKDKYHEVHP